MIILIQIGQNAYYEIYSDPSSKDLSALVSFGWISTEHELYLYIVCNHIHIKYTYIVKFALYTEKSSVNLRNVLTVDIFTRETTQNLFTLTEDDNSQTIQFDYKRDAIEFVSNILTETGFFNVEDFFITTSLTASNYISAVFILIGLTMYYRIVDDEAIKNKIKNIGIILTMMFIACGQVAVMAGYQSWLFGWLLVNCLSNGNNYVLLIIYC